MGNCSSMAVTVESTLDMIITALLLLLLVSTEVQSEYVMGFWLINETFLLSLCVLGHMSYEYFHIMSMHADHWLFVLGLMH